MAPALCRARRAERADFFRLVVDMDFDTRNVVLPCFLCRLCVAFAWHELGAISRKDLDVLPSERLLLNLGGGEESNSGLALISPLLTTIFLPFLQAAMQIFVKTLTGKSRTFSPKQKRCIHSICSSGTINFYLQLFCRQPCETFLPATEALHFV